jgi:L-lactate utilization protein LutB
MMNTTLQELAQTLQKRGFQATVCASADEARTFVLQRVAEWHANRPLASVGAGNSDTTRATGLLEVLARMTPNIYIHKPLNTTEDDRLALTADLYLTSANAVALDGYIVNIDGTGNRTAATCFGPRQVIYLIGRNKVVPTLDDALARARQAAVALCRRYGRKTPCVVTGICEECLSPECICAVTTIHRKKPYGVEMTVVLIDEDLGV